MLQSMTAFASRTGSAPGVTWQWDLRSVNARGLDLRLRLPEGLDGLEAAVRGALKAAVARGNVTLNLRLGRDEAQGGLEVDTGALDQVLAALDLVQDRAMAQGVTLGQPTAADVLGMRGVLQQASSEPGDSAALVAALTDDFAALVQEFTAMRAAEGRALREVLAGQLDRIDGLVAEAGAALEPRKAEAAAALRAAMERVLAEVAEADEARLAQELALIATKQDITEELDRLRAHIAAAGALLKSDAPVGRKLDFLSQEFNREANTLCSKSQNAALTAIGLELKAVIDQMREQVQNVE